MVSICAGMTEQIATSNSANKERTMVPDKPSPLPHDNKPEQPPAPRPFLSVIIPAYNEEQRLGESLQKVLRFFGGRNHAEVIVVDDGSSDRTAEIVETFMQHSAGLRLLRVPHGGKGHACKQGVLASRGEWLYLCDSDLSSPIEELLKFFPHFAPDHDILIASREIPGACRYDEPLYRHMMGRVFNLLVRVLAVHGIQDTQCGFKCFRYEVAQDLFSLQTIDGWGFDVEILFMAQKRGYRIEEIAVDWYYQNQSKVHPLRDAVHMFREVWHIRWNAWRGRYRRPGEERGR